MSYAVFDEPSQPHDKERFTTPVVILYKEEGCDSLITPGRRFLPRLLGKASASSPLKRAARSTDFEGVDKSTKPFPPLRWPSTPRPAPPSEMTRFCSSRPVRHVSRSSTGAAPGYRHQRPGPHDGMPPALTARHRHATPCTHAVDLRFHHRHPMTRRAARRKSAIDLPSFKFLAKPWPKRGRTWKAR